MDSRHQRIVFLGPPACGKGTQVSMLAARSGLPTVVTGEMLRRSAAAGTPTGLAAKEYMDRGDLVPDSVLNRLVSETLEDPAYAGGFILDGYPRTVDQAKFLTGYLQERQTPLTDVVAIEVPHDMLVRRQAGRLICKSCGRVYNRHYLPPPSEGRCACGGELYQRADDSEEVIRTRLEVYRTNTAPLLAYFRRQGVLREVDGSGVPQRVQESILAVLDRGGGPA
ncbi:MAG: adenylate kinase [Bacillota bacterium]|nr:adenylate kinase [Bacillota bacterium]